MEKHLANVALGKSDEPRHTYMDTASVASEDIRNSLP
jgi:hypothetical protein